MELYQILMLIFTGIIAMGAMYGITFQLRGIIESRQREETERHLGFLLHLNELWDSDPFIESRKAVYDYTAADITERLKEADDNNEKEYFIALRVANFFEDLGLVVDHGYIDKKLVMESLGPAIKGYYELFQNFIKQSREQEKDYTLYEYFERLAT